MTAVLGIYAGTVASLAIVGGALAVLLRRLDTPVSVVEVIPLGFSGAVALLYPLGWLMPVNIAGVAIILTSGAVLVSSGLASVLRRGAPRAQPWAAWCRKLASPSALIIVLALISGAFLLIPLMQIGVPTTISSTIADGWSYVATIEWFGGHSLRDQPVADVAHPLQILLSAQIDGGAGIGFEMVSSSIGTLLGRDAFELVNAVSAVGAPIAVCGWASLLKCITRSWPGWPGAALGITGLAPSFVLLFTENQAPHFVALALWPFVVVTTLELATRPSVGRLILAVLACAGLLGVYTSILPWLVIGVVIAVLAGVIRRQPGTQLRSCANWLRIFRRGAIVVVGLATAVMIAGAFQVRQALRFISNVNGDVGVAAPKVPLADHVLLFLGVREQHAFSGPLPVSRAQEILGGLVVCALLIVVWRLGGRAIRGSGTLVALLIGTLAISVAVFTRFRVNDPYGYAAFKATISGGYLVAGLAVIVLVAVSSRAARLAAVPALLALTAIAAPVTVDLLRATTGPQAQGFQPEDIALGRELRKLPANAVALVEGAAETGLAFRLRMSAAYFGIAYARRTMEGLGSTSSYVATPAGGPEWRPRLPWDVVVANEVQPLAVLRAPLWTSADLTLFRAPELDITTFGQGWSPARPSVAGPTAWTTGKVELIVSNRSPRTRRVDVTFEARAGRDTRSVRVAQVDGSSVKVVSLGAGWRPVRYALIVPPNAVASVAVSADRSAVTDRGTKVLALRRINVSDLPARSRSGLHLRRPPQQGVLPAAEAIVFQFAPTGGEENAP